MPKKRAKLEVGDHVRVIRNTWGVEPGTYKVAAVRGRIISVSGLDGKPPREFEPDYFPSLLIDNDSVIPDTFYNHCRRAIDDE